MNLYWNLADKNRCVNKCLFLHLMHPAIEIHSRHSHFAFFWHLRISKDVIKVEHAVDALRAIPGENLETGIVQSNMHVSQRESLRMLILDGLFFVMYIYIYIYHLTSHVFFSSCLCSTSWMMESWVLFVRSRVMRWFGGCKTFATSSSDWNIDSSTHRLDGLAAISMFRFFKGFSMF